MDEPKKPTTTPKTTTKQAADTSAAAPMPTAEATTSGEQKTSGLAIAALILAFVFPLVGLILGIVALSSIKKSGEKGKGLAMAGIILSSIFILLTIIFFATFAFAINKAAKDSGVNIDGKNGNFSVTNKDGDSATIGSNAKLPDGFPSDVPIYEPSDVIASVKTGEGAYSVSLLTNDSQEEVNDFYSTELQKNGWTSGDSAAQFNFSGGSASSFTKGDQRLSVIIASDPSNEKKTSITLAVTKNN